MRHARCVSNARARNAHVEATSHDPGPAQAAALLAGETTGRRGSASKIASFSSFRLKKEEKEEKKEDAKGPVKGIAKKMINLAARQAGGAPASAMRQLGATARDVAEVRDLFQWKDPKKTLPVVAGNVFMAAFHYMTPLWMFFVPAVCGAFFVLTEKLKALERVAAKGPAARKRYVTLQKLKAGEDPEDANTVLKQPSERPVLAELSRSTLAFAKSYNRAGKG